MLPFPIKRQVPLAALLGAALLGLGCGGPPKSKSPESEPAIVDLTDPTRPIPIERFTMPDAGRMGPGDFVEIRLFGYPELSGTFLIAQDGRLNLNLVGGVMAAGKTGDELDRDLTAAYSTYYRDVDIAVNVNARSERFVYVLGEITKPGRFDFRPGDRVVHSLAMAGGMTGKAREDGVILLRREADGDHVYRLDFSHLFQKIAPQDIYLQPADVVFVPKNRFRTVFEVAYDLIDVLGRTATTALIIDDLSRRTRNLTIAR